MGLREEVSAELKRVWPELEISSFPIVLNNVMTYMMEEGVTDVKQGVADWLNVDSDDPNRDQDEDE